MSRVSQYIFNNINESHLYIKTERFIFYFSSNLNMQRFAERFKDNRINLKYNFKSRFMIDFEANDYFDFILYAKIEKRGFKVVNKRGEIIRCLNNLTLNGEIKT